MRNEYIFCLMQLLHVILIIINIEYTIASLSCYYINGTNLRFKMCISTNTLSEHLRSPFPSFWFLLLSLQLVLLCFVYYFLAFFFLISHDVTRLFSTCEFEYKIDGVILSISLWYFSTLSFKKSSVVIETNIALYIQQK